MPEHFILQRVYLRSEYDPRFPAALHAVGELLKAAIDGLGPDPEIDRLCKRLDTIEQPTHH